MEFTRYDEKVWLSCPTIHGEEKKFIEEAFDTNWVAPLGPNVNEFEKEIAAYLGIKDAAALNSGTSALHLAMKLAGVKPGDIVFCSDLTFAATVNPVSYEGGKQVFIDSEYDTWNMDPVALKKAFEKYDGSDDEHKKPKAVVLAHLYGTPSKIDEIMELCKEYNVPLIEDAAESLSATYKGRQTGTFGKWAAISFNGNKIITSSGGGMFLCDNADDVAKVRFWSTQAREPFPWYQHEEIGYNYRMSNIVAGVGRGQLIHLNEHRDLKEKIYMKYLVGLNDLPVKMNPYDDENSVPNFWLSCMTIDEAVVNGTSSEWNQVTPEQVRLFLDQYNVETRPIWKPMHLQPVFAENDFVSAVEDKGVGEDIFNRGICLPSDIKMKEEVQQDVIDMIHSLFVRK